jgi:hypothetical protein
VVGAHVLLVGEETDISITPQMLGHWRDPDTDCLVIEFEYQPSTREYPATMTRLREYMGSALKVHSLCYPPLLLFFHTTSSLHSSWPTCMTRWA